MTTRNLYTSDTVVATFLYSFLRGDTKTAALCIKELIDSGESQLARRIITFAWLCDDPCYNTANRLNTYTDIESFLPNLLSNRTINIPSISESVSIPPIPYETAFRELPWKILPNGWTPQQANTVWIALKDSLYHKNITRALYITAYLIKDNKPAIANLLVALDVSKIIQIIFTANASVVLAYRILHLAYASIVHTVESAADKSAVVDHILKTDIPSGRVARTFRILPQACADWNASIAPESELQGTPRLLERGTTYWQEVVRTYNISFTENELQFANDEVLEAFYTNYFPDDIPDEWSSDERRKSHGCIMPTEKNPLYIPLAAAFSQFTL